MYTRHGTEFPFNEIPAILVSYDLVGPLDCCERTVVVDKGQDAPNLLHSHKKPVRLTAISELEWYMVRLLPVLLNIHPKGTYPRADFIMD